MEYSNELRIKSAHYILSGFSIVVGLSWNEFIRKSIDKTFPMNSDALFAKFLYCLFITAALIIFIKFMPSTDKELPKPVQKQLAIGVYNTVYGKN